MLCPRATPQILVGKLELLTLYHDALGTVALLAVSIGGTVADTLAAHIAQLALVIKRRGAKGRVGNNGNETIARAVLRGHRKAVPAELTKSCAGSGIDVRHIGCEGGGHIAEGAVTPDIRSGDRHRLVAKAIQIACHAERDVIQLHVHHVLDGVRTDDLRMLLAAKLDRLIQMVDGAHNNVLCRGQDALRAHHNGRAGKAGDGGNTDKVGTEAVSAFLDARGEISVHSMDSFHFA